MDYNSEQSVGQDIPFEKLSDSQDNPFQMQQAGKLARGCRAVAEYLFVAYLGIPAPFGILTWKMSVYVINIE